MNTAIKRGFEGRLGGIACSIVSNISDKHKRLIALGDILRDEGLPDLELDSDVIKKEGTRTIENSVRGCTLLELVFRYMDHLKVKGHRWFFRPVEARLIGYAGYFKRKAKATAAPVRKSAVESDSDEEEEEEASESPVKPVKTLRRSKSKTTESN
jgi:hypothetical protein